VGIDFGSRIASIHNEYEAEGDWERELFIESSSFAVSTYAGITVGANGRAVSHHFFQIAILVASALAASLNHHSIQDTTLGACQI